MRCHLHHMMVLSPSLLVFLLFSLLAFLFPAPSDAFIPSPPPQQRSHSLIKMAAAASNGNDPPPNPTTTTTPTSKGNQQSTTRADMLRQTFLASSSLAFLLSPTLPALAAASEKKRIKGAAEIDAEAYIQDLLKGNPLTGGLEKTVIPIRPARQMDMAFATFLDKATVEQISKISGVPPAAILDEINTFRKQVEPSFQRRLAFPSEDLSNEYTFDCQSYCDFRIAAKLIPNLNARVNFVQGLGEMVLNKIMATASPDLRSSIKIYKAEEEGLETALEGMDAILRHMQEKKFIKSFSINQEDYDRYSWDEGYQLELLLTVVEPATLGGNVQFTGENSLFHPDYVVETLLSYLRKCGVKSCNSLQYFLDTEYRPNPKDYSPSEILYQIVLENSKASASKKK